MDLSFLFASNFEKYPVAAGCAVAIRSAKRVLPILKASRIDDDVAKRLANDLKNASDVVEGTVDPELIVDDAEFAYQIAASAAVSLRSMSSNAAGKAVIAGQVVHLALDAVSDMKRDPDSSRIAISMGIRLIPKLNKSEFAEAIQHDLLYLDSRCQTPPPSAYLRVADFGPLWTGRPPKPS